MQNKAKVIMGRMASIGGPTGGHSVGPRDREPLDGGADSSGPGPDEGMGWDFESVQNKANFMMGEMRGSEGVSTGSCYLTLSQAQLRARTKPISRGRGPGVAGVGPGSDPGGARAPGPLASCRFPCPTVPPVVRIPAAGRRPGGAEMARTKPIC